MLLGCHNHVVAKSLIGTIKLLEMAVDRTSTQAILRTNLEMIQVVLDLRGGCYPLGFAMMVVALLTIS